MDDYILRITAAGNRVLAFIATTRVTVAEAVRLHGTFPVASAALGRLLTAAAMMGVSLKNEGDLLTLNIKGDGPIGGITATSDMHSRVKGYVINGQIDVASKKPGKLNVSGAVGNGSLYVMKDMGLKEPYIGQIPLITGEIAEDLTNYFAVSEQTPSAVGLGVLIDTDSSVRQAGGFLIQLMPDADEEVISCLEERVRNLPPFTSMLDRGQTPHEIAESVFKDMGYTIHEMIPVTYHCNCSLERVERALVSLGRDEIYKIISEDGCASLHCHFCNNDYKFDKDALEIILKTM